MQRIFVSTLLASCAGSVLIILLTIIKRFAAKRFSASWHYYIWLAVLIVMLLPAGTHKKYVEVNLLGEVAENIFDTEQTERIISEQPSGIIGGDITSQIPQTVKRGFRVNPFDILPWIWILGAVIFIMCALISYWIFLFKRRKCTLIEGEIDEFLYAKDRLNIKGRILLKKSDETDAPMLAGVFRPVIYVPERAIDKEELVMIFMHELTHYKRRDLWYKWFSLAVNALHWFNPLMYLAAANINEYCELSCDDCVTRDMNDEQKKKYMNTIIGLIRRGDRRNV